MSLYQILRGGSSIAITSILKHFCLPGEGLQFHHWVGVAISVVSIILCAQSAASSGGDGGGGSGDGEANSAPADAAAASAALATWGVVLILLGGTVQAMQ